MGQQIPAHLNKRGGIGRVGTVHQGQEEVAGAEEGAVSRGGGCQQVGAGAVPYTSVLLEALKL